MNATDLTLIQRGERRYAIERSYRYLPWHPTSLFSSIAREAIINLSQTADVQAVSTAAVNAFLSAAMKPGLDLHGLNPYTLSQDFCATLRTVLEYVSRSNLLTLHRAKDVEVAGVPWTFINPADDTGTLHRWVFVDAIGEGDIYHHVRSWEVFADLAIAQVPLELHLIAIGQTRSSNADSPRRISPWCRIFSSPVIANTYKFKNKTGNGQLDSSWKPVWFSDSTRNRATTWVDLMERDDILPSLTHNLTIAPPTEAHRQAFLSRDLPQLLSRIQVVSTADPFTLPMCRNSCDSPFPCPHEHVCYSATPSLITLEKSGLYAKLPARKIEWMSNSAGSPTHP